MQKNNSCVMKVEKICTKRYLKILVAFIPLQFLLINKALFLRLGSSVHHFEHVIKQETLIFAKMTNN